MSAYKHAFEAIEHLRSLVDFAYQEGFHELGYDPVKVVRLAIEAAAKETEAREVIEQWLRETGLRSSLTLWTADDMKVGFRVDSGKLARLQRSRSLFCNSLAEAISQAADWRRAELSK